MYNLPDTNNNINNNYYYPHTWHWNIWLQISWTNYEQKSAEALQELTLMHVLNIPAFKIQQI